MAQMTHDQKVLSTLVYVVKDHKTLMLHRVKKKGDIHQDKYNGLGGKIEPGEAPLQCAKREVLEESGLTAKKVTFKGNLFFPEFDKQNRDWQVYLYRVDEFEGELLFESAEGKLEWFSNKEVLDLNLWEGDKIFIPYVYGPQIIEGIFRYKDGKLDSHQLTVFDQESSH